MILTYFGYIMFACILYIYRKNRSNIYLFVYYVGGANKVKKSTLYLSKYIRYNKNRCSFSKGGILMNESKCPELFNVNKAIYTALLVDLQYLRLIPLNNLTILNTTFEKEKIKTAI